MYELLRNTLTLKTFAKISWHKLQWCKGVEDLLFRVRWIVKVCLLGGIKNFDSPENYLKSVFY